jgi:hypothetical protein
MQNATKPKPHDFDIAEVMSELAEFYYPGARFVCFPGVVEVVEGEVFVMPSTVLDTRGGR